MRCTCEACPNDEAGEVDVTGLVQRPVVNGLLPVVLRVQLAVHIQTHLKPTCHASVNTNTPTTNTSCHL